MYKVLLFDAITTSQFDIEFNLFDVELKHDLNDRHISYVKLLGDNDFTEIFTDSIVLRFRQEGEQE